MYFDKDCDAAGNRQSSSKPDCTSVSRYSYHLPRAEQLLLSAVGAISGDACDRANMKIQHIGERGVDYVCGARRGEWRGQYMILRC